MTDDQQVEARERRRAKILATREARMARITGAHKGESSSSESLKVDEVVLQELIAESKKHAVELAKEDYSRTHKENEIEPDELLTPAQIKEKQEEQLRNQMARLHEATPAGHLESFLSILVVIVSAISGAYFLLKRSPSTLKFCFSPVGIAAVNIEECRAGLLPAFLQSVPAAFAMALVPILSDWFKGRKSLISIVGSILTRSVLFLVIFLISIRIIPSN